MREQLIAELKERQLVEFTIDSLDNHPATCEITRKQIGNCFHHMKNSGIIRDTGKREGNMKVWTWEEHPMQEVEAKTDYRTIGEQVVEVLKKQDEQIRRDTETIRDLTQTINELQQKNNELSNRINSLTNGRITVAELSQMNKRASMY